MRTTLNSQPHSHQTQAKHPVHSTLASKLHTREITHHNHPQQASIPLHTASTSHRRATPLTALMPTLLPTTAPNQCRPTWTAASHFAEWVQGPEQQVHTLLRSASSPRAQSTSTRPESICSVPTRTQASCDCSTSTAAGVAKQLLRKATGHVSNHVWQVATTLSYRWSKDQRQCQARRTAHANGEA